MPGQLERLSSASFARIISAGGLYQLSFSVLYGTTIYTTLVSGPLLRAILPRQHLVAFQNKALPAYFNMSLVLSSTCLAIWTVFHPEVLSHTFDASIASVAQAYVLAGTVAVHAANTLYIGPKTHEIILERWKIEEREGKKWDEPNVSAELQAVNKRFWKWHISSISINMVSVIGLTLHGLYIGTHGLL